MTNANVNAYKSKHLTNIKTKHINNDVSVSFDTSVLIKMLKSIMNWFKMKWLITKNFQSLLALKFIGFIATFFNSCTKSDHQAIKVA
jgi:hypothetical protein